jgi:hypothetical protein
LYGWVRALGVLEAHVQIGLTYADYGRYLTNAQVAFNLAKGGLTRESLDCLQRVMLPAARGQGEYLQGYKSWGGCLNKLSVGKVGDCTTGYYASIVQRHWSNASANVDRALRNLG